MPQDRAAAGRFYDRISDAYDLVSNSSESAARNRGIELLAPQPAETILEIGFGTGHALERIAEAVGPQGRVHGVDISGGMRCVAERRLAKAALLDRVDLQVGAAPPLPYPGAHFDAVTLSFTLELFPPDDAPALLAEIKRVLKPSGRLGVVCMSSPSDGQHPSLLERGYIWMHQHFPHIVDCRPIDPDSLLEQAGFEVLQRIDMAIWTLPVAVITAGPAAHLRS